jgi:two-component system sensor histidine kinase TctE
MNKQAANPISIRRQLLWFLVSSALLMLSGAAVVTYWVALASANDAYDRSLLDPAFDIADNVRLDAAGAHVDLPQKALEALVYDQVDNVIFQVRSPSDSVVDGIADLPSPPEVPVGQHIFFDGAHNGEKIRIAALRTPNGFVVQVGETLHKRNRLVWDILFAELVPTLLIALGSIALAWAGVARALIPLEHLRTELIARPSRDLQPLKETAAPIEIAPVISAFNRLLEDLREANTMQQRILTNAAHQLRTPLAGLQMHLELLLRQDLNPDLTVELGRMHQATVRASRLANQLLALAKAEATPEQSRGLETIDLRTVADAAARDWAQQAHAQGIDLGFALERAVILGDPLLLPELVNNLIDNALRYTPYGGTVTVRTGYEDGAPFLEIEDTGLGIPVSERSKVRERFYRMPGTPGDGSGLGLAIVQEVVDRHGGVLEINGREPMLGSCIRVAFPRSQDNDVR